MGNSLAATREIAGSSVAGLSGPQPAAQSRPPIERFRYHGMAINPVFFGMLMLF